MNLETLLSEVWANITIQILSKNAFTTWDRKILIDDKLLIHCFKFKIMLSYHIFQNGNLNFDTLSEISNDKIRQNVNRETFGQFLLKFGPELSVLNDFTRNLGLTTCFTSLRYQKFEPTKH